MKTRSAILLAMTLAGLTLLGQPAQAGRNSGTTNTTLSALSKAERQDLRFMREEEKLARDVYLALLEHWGLTPFANIAGSEQQHMDALLMLLRKYRLTDPTAGLVAGEFANAQLQELYDKLMEQGLNSDVEALKVGGIIEETDIQDLDDALARSDNADIDQVYARLQCGSRNHLRAFARVLAAITGQEYQAQVMDPAAVEVILTSPQEFCGR